MPEEQENDTISDKSNIRLPISLFVGGILTMALAFYAKIEADRLELKQTVADNKLEIERRLSDMSTRIGTKADKSEARDRYTATDHKAFRETLDEKHRTYDVRLESLRRENAIQHENMKLMILHLSDDFENHEEKGK